MSNFPLVKLLKYEPFEALLIAYNDIHGTSLNPRYVMLDNITPSNGQDITVRLKARSDLPNVEEKRFFNVGEITVRRLNLSELFNTPFHLNQTGEVASRDVANAIAAVTGIKFAQDDFIDSVLTTDNNVLTASPSSLRWYGNIVVDL